MIVRIYTGHDGQTHFEDLPLPAEGSHNVALQAGANLVFRCFPADYWSDWHTAPRRQYIFILVGQMEIGIGDGTTRRFGPGDVVLADDLTGQGHTTRSVGVPRISATVPVGAWQRVRCLADGRPRSHTRRLRMPERQPMTTRLKTLFQRPELFVLAGGINPIGAKMAEALGYDAFYMSGGNTSAHQLGWPNSGTSMRDMVDNARKIVLTVEIPVFADADTGYGDAISTHYTVREYIQAGIAGAHIEDQTFPPKSGPRRRCISIPEMVGKLRAAMDAKQALDPDFVIMARCDLGGVPGAGFAEIIERCQAYKAEAQVDVLCPNGLRTWEEIREAIRLIPGPVVPLIPAHLSPYPSLQAQQDAGAAAAWFPALTTMAGLQANWDFLSDFRQRGTLALDALRAQAAQSPWGVASNGRILDEPRLRAMEEMYLPD